MSSRKPAADFIIAGGLPGFSIEGFHFMSDTVKIKRPMSCRRHENLGGRTAQDPVGNSLKVRTRAEDSKDDFDSPLLERTLNLEKGSTG
jgi:hypothetical protein